MIIILLMPSDWYPFDSVLQTQMAGWPLPWKVLEFWGSPWKVLEFRCCLEKKWKSLKSTWILKIVLEKSEVPCFWIFQYFFISILDQGEVTGKLTLLFKGNAYRRSAEEKKKLFLDISAKLSLAVDYLQS